MQMSVVVLTVSLTIYSWKKVVQNGNLLHVAPIFLTILRCMPFACTINTDQVMLSYGMFVFGPLP